MAATEQYVSASQGIATIARIAAFAGALVLIFLQLIAGPAFARDFEPGEFDYYALALSWSPTYCETASGSDDSRQCAPGRRFAFVVHGLWPQFEQGWPQNCDTVEDRVPEPQIDAMMDIMPSRDLVIHEWTKHGTCSGLGIAEYFAAARRFFAKVKVPARYLSPNTDLVVTPQQIATDFVKTNHDLTMSTLSVQCAKRGSRVRLTELRICFDRDGAFRDCGENERRKCRAKSLVLPRVR
jgi:ribonuclease T2